MSPIDMATAYKNTTTLKFDGFARDMCATFGMSQDGIRRMWQVQSSKAKEITESSGDRQINIGVALHRQQLLPGDHLEDITSKYLDQIRQSLIWAKIPDKSTSPSTEKRKVVSLYSWCAAVFGNATVQALFGNVLLELEPRLLEYYNIFDDESWKLTYQLPTLFAKRMHAALDSSREAYIRYYQLPSEKRAGACHYIRTVEAKQRQVGMNDRDIALHAQMFFWGLVNGLFLLHAVPLVSSLTVIPSAAANPFKVSFWLLSHMIYDPELLQSVRKEVAPSITNDGAIDIQSLLDHSPVLDAAFHEVLRLTSINSTVRYIETPVIIGGKKLGTDGQIMMPHRQLHLEESAFGSEPRKFNVDRFLQDKDLSRSRSFKPFGGGQTYCSGRHVAKREIMAFVALTIHLYDLRLQNPQQAFPRLDLTKPSIGILDRMKGDEVVLVITPRA